MKKKLILTLAALSCLSLGASVIGNPTMPSMRRARMAETQDADFTWPALGTTDPASPMTSQWQSGSYGFKRINDRATAVAASSGWGLRCDYGQKTFIKDGFEVSVNMLNYATGDVLGITCSRAKGAYVSEATCNLNMDIVRNSITGRSHEYMVTLNRAASKNEAHNVSIEGWSNGDDFWLDSYKGVVVTAEDDVITIKFKSVSDTKVKICVNEVEIELDKSLVFETLEDNFYLGFNTGFNAGDHNFIVNYAVDSRDAAYYDETNGTYYAVKNKINAFIKEAKEATLENINEFVTLFNKSLSISFDGLYEWDKNYLQPGFSTAVIDLKNRAIEQYGNNAFIQLFKGYADKLHENIDRLDEEAALKEAMKASDDAKDMIATIESLTLTEEEQATYNAALAQYNQDVNKMNEKAKELYVAAINAVVDKMAKAASAQDVADANVAYASLGTTYRAFVDETTLAELDTKLETARAEFLTKFKANTDDKLTVNGTSYLVNGENDLGLVTSDKGIIFNKEQYDVADFSFTYNMQSKGAYYISLMDNAEFFSEADDPSVADHKGLIFLIRPKSDTEAYVETYMIDGTCSRFFDGQVSKVSFDIPLNGEITFSMKIVTNETSGIYDNYLVYSFNDKSYAQPVIKAQSLLGAFEDKMGYLSIGALNADMSNPLITTIKNINGVTMEKDSYKKAVDYTPKSSVTSFDFKKGTTSNKVLPINPMLSTIKEVSVDGNKLTSSDYSYTRNSTLTIKATYLNTLSAGTHKLRVETENGYLEINANITEEQTTPVNPGTSDTGNTGSNTGATTEEKPTKKGCGGSIAAVSSILGSLTLVATGLVLKKKKDEK